MFQFWLPYLYQYGVGGFFFLLAIVLAWKNGALKPHVDDDRRLLTGLILGFIGYALVHGLWILWAITSAGAAR